MRQTVLDETFDAAATGLARLQGGTVDGDFSQIDITPALPL